MGVTTKFSLSIDGQFGPGSINNIGKTAQNLGMKNPLIVCDPTMVKLGFAKLVQDNLSTAGLRSSLYDQCVENPRVEDIDSGAAFFKKNGCDGIIGLGGGSPIDQAKTIRVVAKYGGSAVDYDIRSGGMKKIGRDMAPMIAVPTTSGTGSEATLAALVTNRQAQVKFVVFSPNIKVSMAILDPELTLSLPPSVTAATGLDAIVHAMESYVTSGPNPIAESLSRRSFELAGSSLKTAVKDGKNIQARTNMMMASLLAGMAFNMTGLGAVHAAAHALGGAVGIAHGTANALMLPHVMRYNASVAEKRYLEAVALLGFRCSNTDQAATAMTNFAKDLGLHVKLSELGVSAELLPQLAKNAFNDVNLARNPAQCTEADLLELFKRAL